MSGHFVEPLNAIPQGIRDVESHPSTVWTVVVECVVALLACG